MKEQRRCSTWRKTKNLTLQNSSSRSWICTMAGGTSYPQLEREYGVNRSTLSNWVKQLSPIKVSEKETVTLKEYKALQKENQRLKIENEI